MDEHGVNNFSLSTKIVNFSTVFFSTQEKKDLLSHKLKFLVQTNLLFDKFKQI